VRDHQPRLPLATLHPRSLQLRSPHILAGLDLDDLQHNNMPAGSRETRDDLALRFKSQTAPALSLR
jgi:hypothetical protein